MSGLSDLSHLDGSYDADSGLERHADQEGAEEPLSTQPVPDFAFQSQYSSGVEPNFDSPYDADSEAEMASEVVSSSPSAESVPSSPLKTLEVETDDPSSTSEVEDREDAREETITEFKKALTDLIKKMMFVSGETAEPSVETTTLIEEITRQQVIEIVSSPFFCPSYV